MAGRGGGAGRGKGAPLPPFFLQQALFRTKEKDFSLIRASLFRFSYRRKQPFACPLPDQTCPLSRRDMPDTFQK